MNDLRTAAQQALELLGTWTKPPARLYRVMDNLRAALAQKQAEPKPMHPELRKMWEEHFDRCFRAMPLPAQEQAEPLNLSDRAVQRRLAAQWGYVPAALAEPAQEPYAWHYTNNAGASVWHRGPSNRLDADMQVARDYPHAHKVTPLYTAPPRRTMVSLTEAEIDHAANSILTDDPVQWWRRLGRAIEKASWEKNHGQA